MDTRRLLRASAALLASATLLLTSCSTGDDDTSESRSPTSTKPGDPDAPLLKPLPAKVPGDLRPYYSQKLRWRSCGSGGFQCAKLRVPLDYEKPGGEDLRLSVVRKRAEDSDRRIGSLQINPGGPGGSAVDYVQTAAAPGYPDEIRARFDLVGMDPRGVARSEPVECLSDRKMDDFTQVDQTPDDDKEVSRLEKAYRQFAQGCRQRTGDRLDHVSTTEAARDMDVLRSALGDRELNYVGASYGTLLGATYAGLFPQRSGRLVLDGAMDPSLSAERLNRDQTAGFNTAFTAFAKDCVKHRDCPLGTKDVKDAGARLAQLFRKVDADPLPTGDRRPLTESLATTGVIRAMYDESSWSMLREALTDARKGDGAALLRLADDYSERDPDGSYSNLLFANPAVNCLDLPASFSDPRDLRKSLPSFKKASPVFGESFAWAALNCTYWKAEPTGKAHRIQAKGADPIVVVGTTRDPATPYNWAEGLAGQLDSASLLTYEGDGHTAYGRGSSCIDSAINSYLLEGKAPEDGKRCSS
ncbi:alpha/beta hydrolase [Streptomyces sp. NPDC005438]|uniref:alpha/beta hydrolase n=1 Tax=Streptomyces sp. NPDC005438 TaxID=3156880 RepID=UPI0033A4870F